MPEAQGMATRQRPVFSSNTNTTASGTTEIETGFLYDVDDAIRLPSTLKVGVTDRTELFLDFIPYQDVDVGFTDSQGFGDLRIGTRQRIWDETEEDPGLAYQLEAKIPTADASDGLGTGETDFFVAAIADTSFNDIAFTSYYQLGFLDDIGDDGVDLEHGLAVAARQAIDYQFTSFGEIALVTAPEQDRDELFTTLGVAYNVDPSFVVDAAIVVGLTSDAPDLQLLFGLTRNFGRITRPR